MLIPIKQVYLSVDAESVGLLGDTWAIGCVLVDRDGQELESHRWHVDPEQVQGTDAGQQWVRDNCAWARQTAPTCWSAAQMRQWFWRYWEKVQRDYGAIMLADHPFPVEAKLLFDCLADDRRRQSPYPLIDCSSVQMDPLASQPRIDGEWPAHDPVADARQSVRLYLEWLRRQEASHG